MKTSLADFSGEDAERKAGRAERCMEVGLAIFIFVLRCAIINGLSPRPAKLDESARGALLGRLVV